MEENPENLTSNEGPEQVSLPPAQPASSEGTQAPPPPPVPPQAPQQYPAQPLPPEAQSIKDFVRIAGLISLIFGIIYLISGIATLLYFVGIVPIIFGIFDLVIWMKCKEITALIDQQRYKDAKDKTLIWMILGFILGGVIAGILLLIAFLKFDSLLRTVPQAPPPPPV